MLLRLKIDSAWKAALPGEYQSAAVVFRLRKNSKTTRAVTQKTTVANVKNQWNPKTMGIKNEAIEPIAAPTESAANTPSGFLAAASNRAGKKLPVTNATGAIRARFASGERLSCMSSNNRISSPPVT